MVMSDSLTPIPARRFGSAQARHLLRRAGFGGTPAQVRALSEMGLDQAVDLLVDYQDIEAGDLAAPQLDPDVIRPPTAEERQRLAQARQQGDQALADEFQRQRQLRQQEDRRMLAALAQWWLGRMIATPRPLEESLVMLWHGHFASNHRQVRDTYLMYRQNETFRRHARGSFAELAHAVVRDPAMLRFLNNNQNRRRQPNENLARELMELFTLGEGHYTEADIREGARALTGYSSLDNDFDFIRLVHDSGQKTILGRTGGFDGDDFVDILLQQEPCARFVAYKLYRHFVADLDDQPTDQGRAVILKLAHMLRGQNYALAPVLKVLLKSEHFHDLAIVGNKIKSPAQLLVGTVRTLNTPVRDVRLLEQAMDAMGQKLFDPPSVAGWDGGRSWINTSTLFTRQNLCAYLITGQGAGQGRPVRGRGASGATGGETSGGGASGGGTSGGGGDYDPSPLLEGLEERTPAAVVGHLLEMLIAPPVPADRRQPLLAFLTQRGGRIDPATLRGLLLLITAMPEYQLC